MEWVADYNRQWTFMLQVMLAVWCAIPVRRVVGPMAALALFWFLAGAVATFQNSFGTYDRLDQTTLLAVEAFALDSAFKLVLLVGAVLWAVERDARGVIALGVSLFAIANAAVILAQFALSPDLCGLNTCGGIVGNPSMSGSLLAVSLPIVVRKLRLAAWVLFPLAIVATRGNSPIGLRAVAVVLSIRSRFASVAVAAMLGLGYALLGRELLNSGDRFEMWRQFLSGWTNPTNWAFGIGLGEFGVAAALIQFSRDVKTNSWWLWAHNDWLQSVIEGGAVGACLLFASWVQAMKRAARPVAVSLFLYGLMMLTNYPLHLATTAVLGAWLMVVALRDAYGERAAS